MEMFTFEARLASFGPAASTSKARRNNAGHSSKSSRSWPHPKSWTVTPESLAAAGFRFQSSDIAEDAVVCVYCDKGLQDWEQGDDPIDEHLKRRSDEGEQCPWALVMAAKRDFMELGGNGCEDPMEESLVAARKSTFGAWWTFDSQPGWKPTSDKVGSRITKVWFTS